MESYLEYLEPCSNYYVVFSSFNSTAFLAPFKATEALRFIREDERMKDRDVYMSFGLFSQPPLVGRGKSEDIAAIPGVFLDIDVSSGGRYTLKNPTEELEGIKAEVQRWGLPDPSAIVSTGNGYHFEWRLSSLFEIKTPSDRARASAMLKGFNAFAMAKAKQRGWKLDPMGDLARVKRAVGSRNFKDPENPRAVEVIEFHPTRTYTMAELEAFKPEAVSIVPSTAPRLQVSEARNKPRFEQVADHCPFVRHCVANADTLSYPEWFAVIGIAARCENGRQIAHDISRPHPGYDIQETERKIEEALKGPGPVTYSYISETLGFDLSAAPLVVRAARSPVSLGYADAKLLPLLNSHVYDLSTERFFNVSTLQPRSEKAFRAEFAHVLGNPTSEFLKSKLATKVVRTDYLPGSERIKATDQGLVLNVYQASGAAPASGDSSLILGHFDYLIPDEAQRTHVLNYLAHLVQKPAGKLKSALFIIGPQGNGKSLLAEVMVEVLGGSNVRVIPPDAVASRFKAERVNTQLLIFNEIMGIDRVSANALKEWITEERVMVEEKGVPRFEARTPRGAIFISNHIDALPLENNERRYAVIETAAVPQDQSYYAELGRAVREQAPAFAHWLSQRDLSTFNPHAPAPDSRLKGDITALHRSPLEAAIREAMDEEVGIFNRDFGTSRDVIETLHKNGWSGRTPSPQTVGKIMAEMGAESLDQQRIPALGTRPRFMAWRNTAKWQLASPSERGTHYIDWLKPANAVQQIGQVA